MNLNQQLKYLQVNNWYRLIVIVWSGHYSDANGIDGINIKVLQERCSTEGGGGMFRSFYIRRVCGVHIWFSPSWIVIIFGLGITFLCDDDVCCTIILFSSFPWLREKRQLEIRNRFTKIKMTIVICKKKKKLSFKMSPI